MPPPCIHQELANSRVSAEVRYCGLAAHVFEQLAPTADVQRVPQSSDFPNGQVAGFGNLENVVFGASPKVV
jgi:hypothetical protein